MNNKYIGLTILAVVLSFIGGFMFANALNKSDLSAPKSEIQSSENKANRSAQNPDEATLSDEDINKRISEADQNPNNINYQKDLGLALYRYAATKQDIRLFGEVTRLLERAFKSNPKDFEVLVILGNAYFDIGYLNKENEKLVKSREFYQAALKEKPNDVDVRTDLGLSFYLTDPPDTERAVSEFQESLKLNADHEKTLQVIAQAYMTQKKPDEAEKYLIRLEKVNPQNTYLPQLKNKLVEIKTAGQNK